ncbi:autotransporter outer membrane beta-barrel domain-containing protein [Pseudoteredinibacter isoporae]|uniref:Uncharacterized protein YhjY with autotransporter beta-barrel domain n=1 Tax=Pseudoteredinibacter isoporae TaxID=570281 RepID=A0A7X0JUA3_9GAMM|nr:autotransporter outer membrane beta-barrel domain-containing protein [Pseudoteredinibacter isoporae]MBB6521954.1 uncharacterized protein YhjY with autotransporter beta-barrel domain [Pseudoteredinibacter isoporae]NHO87490.1 autotransporter outer membrane beta-barrel domain-containing protein [Pseudoteredinibacter isoporae]NIB24179.1 autotransporter outer membrane beta-barrel domain-containing protein [Pseudoteredinibacter isoporae]
MSIALTSNPTFAGPTDFQDFFFNVCQQQSPNRVDDRLPGLCFNVPAQPGDLSTDSEASLNPSQMLSSNDAALGFARANARLQRERKQNPKGGSSGSETPIGPFSVWLNARGQEEDSKRAASFGTERGYDSDSRAFEVGLDYRVNDRLVIGALYAYEDSELDFLGELPGINFAPGNSAGSKDSEQSAFSAFASLDLNPNWYVQASAGFSRSDNDFSRNSVYQESTRSLPTVNSLTAGSADGESQWFSINSGYSFSSDQWTFTPYLALLWANSEVDGFTERDISGTGLNMRFSKMERDSQIGNLGISISGVFNQDFGVLIPQLRLEYEKEFDRDPQQMSASFVQDNSNTLYQFSGESPDDSYFNMGLSLTAVLPHGWIPYVEYQWQASNDSFDRSRWMLGVRKEL